MSAFSRRGYVFLTSHRGPGLAPAERALIPVMAELVRRGASVHLITRTGSAAIGPARAIGVRVAPYRLSRANIVRTVSRLRKYLRRMDPVIGHSSGFEASVLLRLAARPLSIQVVDTILEAEWPPRGRNRSAARVRLSADRRTAGLSDHVLVDSAALRETLVAEGRYEPTLVEVMPELAHVDDSDALVRAHLALYERLVVRWRGPAPVRGPKRRLTVRGVRRDAKRAARGDRAAG